MGREKEMRVEECERTYKVAGNLAAAKSVGDGESDKRLKQSDYRTSTTQKDEKLEDATKQCG